MLKKNVVGNLQNLVSFHWYLVQDFWYLIMWMVIWGWFEVGLEVYQISANMDLGKEKLL